MRREWKVLIDGDDTIWKCNIYHRHADQTCIGFLRTIWPDGSITDEEVFQLQRRIHRSVIKQRGFWLNLNQYGWLKTYRVLCERYRTTPDPKVAAQLEAIASEPLKAPYELFPGAREALHHIRELGYTLHLITTGDDAFQRSKVTRHGLDDIFNDVHVVQFGKEGVMLSYARRYRHNLMIGDSISRDINPALRFGFTAAWIRNGHHDSYQSRHLDPHKTHIFNSVEEVPPMMSYFR